MPPEVLLATRRPDDITGQSVAKGKKPSSRIIISAAEAGAAATARLADATAPTSLEAGTYQLKRLQLTPKDRLKYALLGRVPSFTVDFDNSYRENFAEVIGGEFARRAAQTGGGLGLGGPDISFVYGGPGDLFIASRYFDKQPVRDLDTYGNELLEQQYGRDALEEECGAAYESWETSQKKKGKDPSAMTPPWLELMGGSHCCFDFSTTREQGLDASRDPSLSSASTTSKESFDSDSERYTPSPRGSRSSSTDSAYSTVSTSTGIHFADKHKKHPVLYVGGPDFAELRRGMCRSLAFSVYERDLDVNPGNVIILGNPPGADDCVRIDYGHAYNSLALKLSRTSMGNGMEFANDALDFFNREKIGGGKPKLWRDYPAGLILCPEMAEELRNVAKAGMDSSKAAAENIQATLSQLLFAMIQQGDKEGIKKTIDALVNIVYSLHDKQPESSDLREQLGANALEEALTTPDATNENATIAAKYFIKRCTQQILEQHNKTAEDMLVVASIIDLQVKIDEYLTLIDNGTTPSMQLIADIQVMYDALNLRHDISAGGIGGVDGIQWCKYSKSEPAFQGKLQEYIDDRRRVLGIERRANLHHQEAVAKAKYKKTQERQIELRQCIGNLTQELHQLMKSDVTSATGLTQMRARSGHHTASENGFYSVVHGGIESLNTLAAKPTVSEQELTETLQTIAKAIEKQSANADPAIQKGLSQVATAIGNCAEKAKLTATVSVIDSSLDDSISPHRARSTGARSASPPPRARKP